jgi:hypothetical protein
VTVDAHERQRDTSLALVAGDALTFKQLAAKA